MIPGMLDTGPSAWAPLALIGAFALLFVLVGLLRASGRRGFRYGKERARPFYSGNIAAEGTRVKASDYFWGFFEAFRDYYNWMGRLHSGVVNDYVFWFVAVAAVALAALALGVVQWT